MNDLTQPTVRPEHLIRGEEVLELMSAFMRDLEGLTARHSPNRIRLHNVNVIAQALAEAEERGRQIAKSEPCYTCIEENTPCALAVQRDRLQCEVAVLREGLIDIGEVQMREVIKMIVINTLVMADAIRGRPSLDVTENCSNVESATKDGSVGPESARAKD